MERSGAIESHQTRVGRDGVEQPATKPKPEPQPDADEGTIDLTALAKLTAPELTGAA